MKKFQGCEIVFQQNLQQMADVEPNLKKLEETNQSTTEGCEWGLPTKSAENGHMWNQTKKIGLETFHVYNRRNHSPTLKNSGIPHSN